MKVIASEPGRLVHWSCSRGPDEWPGTGVSFQLTWKQDQTYVLSRHANWREPVEFMHHCSTKWAWLLCNLRDYIEQNNGRPAPYDFKIHVGE
jgi:hypothetical protein